MCVVRTTQDDKRQSAKRHRNHKVLLNNFCDTRVVYSGKRATMRKYLLAFVAMMAGTIIAAEPMQLALDANGNAAKIFIPKDAFTIEE
jgi:hypothetical protein